jgi:NADH-quinone oxidoreductase subunit J
MMLDVDFTELRQGFLQYLPLGGLLFLIFVLELGGVVFTWAFAPDISHAFASPIPPLANVTNTAALGQVLYTRYVYFFQASGLILLVAMVGAIVLTLRHKPNVKRQNIAEQVARTKATAIEIVKVQSGQGVS